MESSHLSTSTGSQTYDQDLETLRISLAEEIKLIRNEKEEEKKVKGRSKSDQTISKIAIKVMDSTVSSSNSPEEQQSLLQRTQSDMYIFRKKQNKKQEDPPPLERKYSEKKMPSSSQMKIKKGWGFPFSFFTKSSFKHTLDTPIMTKQEWEEASFKKLEEIIKEKFEGKRDIQEIVEKFIKSGVSTTNFHKRLNEAYNKEKLEYLLPFTKTTNPALFLEAANKLSQNKKNYKIFLEIIGGEEILGRLNSFLDPYKKFRWKSYVEKFLTVDLVLASSSFKKIGFTYGFDTFHPLSFCKPQDIVSSFRYYAQSIKIDRKTSFFILSDFITETPLFLPEPKQKKTTEEEKLKSFLNWLIANLELKMNIVNPPLDSIAQSKCLVDGIINTEEKEELIRKMKKVFKKKGMKDFVAILNMMREQKLSESLIKWSEYHLLSIIRKKQSSSAEILATNVINEYLLQKSLDYCRVNVPLFRLLQCMSFNAFSYLTENLATYCPQLINPQQIQNHKLKDTGPTFFKILTNPKNKDFLIEHRKKYQIQDPINSSSVKAKLEIVWVIKGNLNKDYFLPTLGMDNIVFSEDVSLDERYTILQKLGLLAPKSLS